MINSVSHLGKTPLTFCNGEYKKVLDLWNSLPKNQQKAALDKANIYYKSMNIDISHYTRKVALRAIGMI